VCRNDQSLQFYINLLPKKIPKKIYFLIGKLNKHLVSLEPMTSSSITLLCKEEVSFELELIGKDIPKELIKET
jgi:hypothetical protein